MKKLYPLLFLTLTFTTANSQGFTNPGFETWSSNCPVNTAPFTWVNFSSSLGPDQAGTCAGVVVSQQGTSHANIVWANTGLAEGMQQLVSGFSTTTSYGIKFYAIHDQGLYASTGSCFLDVYLDNVVIYSTPELFNGGPWTSYQANFTATATSHIVGFQVRAGTTGSSGSVGVDNLTVVVTTGVNASTSLDMTINVFPNPSTGIFNVSSTKEITSIEVVDVVGAKVLTQQTNNLTNSPINLSNQAKGIYFVKIKTSEGEVVKKVVLE